MAHYETANSRENGLRAARTDAPPANLGQDGPRPRAAYIHVPFCRHRCGYCDFAVIAGRDDLIPRYLDAVARELRGQGGPNPVDTLYFGGGTPTHLGDDALDALCSVVLDEHPLNAGYEWTVEANPEDVAGRSLERLAAGGVTRLSLGVQALNDDKLRSLDRQHDRAMAIDAIDHARAAGLGVSIDLIFAAPGETLDGWRRELAEAIALAPDHISSYGLTFELATAFGVGRERGTLREVDEELQRAMYGEAIDRLAAAGYEHYEVSNFARPGRRSRHNEVYWAGDEYFAAGPGAARYVGGVRETNIRSTIGYLARIEASQSPVADREELPPERRARERLVLGLRRMRGVDRQPFAEITGYDVDELAGEKIATFAALGLLADDGQNIRLTRDGLFVSDALWPELL
jgi:oxygen-independent coproporphyrinogen-3 oxidase